MEEIYYGSVIVWYSYTVEVSEFDCVELWKCDIKEQLYCGNEIVWLSYTAEI